MSIRLDANDSHVQNIFQSIQWRECILNYSAIMDAGAAAGWGSGMTCSTSPGGGARRSEEHTSELQSLMRISYAVFCLKIQSLQNKIPNILHKRSITNLLHTSEQIYRNIEHT